MSRAERRAAAREAIKNEMAKNVHLPVSQQHTPPTHGGGQMALPNMGGQIVHQTAKTTIYPFAEDLEAYNRAIPNGGERLFDNFLAQSNHRQALENRVVDSNIRQAERGQLIGAGLAIAGIGAAVFAAMKGHDTFAGVMITVVLAGGFGVFITGRAQQQRDLKRKRQAAETAGSEG